MDPTNHINFARFEPLRRYVPLLVWMLVLLTLLTIPLKIVGYGYVAPDDALRHAAKAVSGKSWSEIMVLNSVYQIDHEFGWNLLLEKIHVATGANAETLMLFSVVSLFVLLGVAAILWLEFPEAWLVALTLAMIFVTLPSRFLLGRPDMIMVAALVTVLWLWRRHGGGAPKAWMAGVATAAVAVSVYFQGTWYLWALPVLAFFLAGQFRWAFAMAASAAAGVVLGSALTGHPVAYPVQAVKLALLCVGAQDTVRTMAGELQPKMDLTVLIVLALLLVLRRMAGLKTVPFLRDPVFWVVVVGWTLSLKVGRFGGDWAWPALMVLMAGDLQLLLAARVGRDSFARLALAGGFALITFLCLTSDVGSRWTGSLTQQSLEADSPDLRGWLPEKDGVLYSSDSTVFYRTFYQNPRADWRYLPGFEPAWMPAEDFNVYHNILWNSGAVAAYAPWVKQMRLPDRLVIRGGPPAIPELEWKYGAGGLWIGRLPGIHPDGPPPAVRASSPSRP
jgi:hypothetical protein